MTHIALIKLGGGRSGFYDELTNIHLTLSQPVAHIYDGQNLTNIKRGIKSGSLVLLQGTLSPNPAKAAPEPVGNTPVTPVPVAPVDSVKKMPSVATTATANVVGDTYITVSPDSEDEIVTIQIETGGDQVEAVEETDDFDESVEAAEECDELAKLTEETETEATVTEESGTVAKAVKAPAKGKRGKKKS